MSHHIKTQDAARSKWRGILLQLGVPEASLSGRHVPCPLCGGEDRFRFDNQEGRGTYICNQCGAGDGLKLAMEFTGKPFYEAAGLIDDIIGNVRPDADRSRAEMSDEDRRRILREMYAASGPVQPGDLADVYLTCRGVGEVAYPPALRFAPSLRDGEGGVRPAMLAMVGVPGADRFATIHRTFLRPDGRAKAEMPAPRKLAPGGVPEGACVQLGDWTGGPLGIAEGIETALSASALHGMVVWSAINSTILQRWFPPGGCTEVVIFGDNDKAFGGQAAAYALAHRLGAKGIRVEVHIPPISGTDWNDVHLSTGASDVA